VLSCWLLKYFLGHAAAGDRAVFPVPKFIEGSSRCATSLGSADVTHPRLRGDAFERGLPKTIRFDNGSTLLGTTAFKRDHYI
jgi:hypothetical protein